MAMSKKDDDIDSAPNVASPASMSYTAHAGGFKFEQVSAAQPMRKPDTTVFLKTATSLRGSVRGQKTGSKKSKDQEDNVLNGMDLETRKRIDAAERGSYNDAKAKEVVIEDDDSAKMILKTF